MGASPESDQPSRGQTDVGRPVVRAGILGGVRGAAETSDAGLAELLDTRPSPLPYARDASWYEHDGEMHPASRAQDSREGKTAVHLVQRDMTRPPQPDRHLAQQGVFRRDLAAGKGEFPQHIEAAQARSAVARSCSARKSNRRWRSSAAPGVRCSR